MIHQSEPLVKPFLEFQKIFLKNRQNCKKCNKIAIKTQKFAKNYKKIAKNDNETLKIYCNLTPIVVGNLRSIQHTWYLPKNGSKIAKKWQKRPKNSKKMAKMGDFAQQNVPLRNDYFRLFSHPSSCPVREARFGPPNFDCGLCFHGDMTETKLPFFTIFVKNNNFFTDQDMIEAIAQNCAKTKAPTKKLIKSTLKYTDRGAFSTY